MNRLSKVVRATVTLCLVCTGPLVATSVKAMCIDPPGQYQVNLYTDWHYGGTCVTVNVGSYPNAASLGIHNDWTSSVKVGSGVRVALFQDDNYGGFEATYITDAAEMGLANDQVSSAVVQYDFQESLYLYSSVGWNQTWTQDAQGLAVERDGPIFITQTRTLWRFASGTYLAGTNCNSAGVMCQGIPSQLSGYDHFGDPEYYNGHVLVPVEDSQAPRMVPVVAVFRASDLAFEGWDYLDGQATDAAWLAVRPGALTLWSSDGNIQNTAGNLLHYWTMNWSSLCTSGPPACDFLSRGGSKTLYRRNGTAVNLKGLQGGDFTDDGDYLFLSNGSNSCSGGDWDGARLFKMSNGGLVAQGDDEAYGQFAVENHCGGTSQEEMEGIDVDASNEVHIWVLDNNYPNQDKVYWKTYLTVN